MHAGPLLILISGGMPNDEKAYRKNFIMSLAFSPLRANAKLASKKGSMDTCKYLNCPKD